MTWLGRYIPHACVERAVALGYIIEPGLEGTHHGEHSVWARWERDSEPPAVTIEVAPADLTPIKEEG